MTAKRWIMRLCCVILLLATLACQVFDIFAPNRTVEPTPTVEVGLTPVSPADTPIPEPEIPYPAPKLLERSPRPGQAQPLEGAIELVFDQPMDRDSTIDAFSIEPEVPGDLIWTDARTLQFVPQKLLARGTAYRITVGESALNTAGLPVVEPYTFDFNTIGYLEVSEVQPAVDSTEIDPDMGVTVIFNRPVVPLTSLDRQSELPDPLTFVPPVSGQGEWLNTSIYRFYPDAGFMPSTSYTARVAGGLVDTLGYTMAEDYSWSFTTQSPYVQRWYPRSNTEHIGPSEVISVTFSQPMNRASVEDAFSATINGQTLEGKFTWSGGKSPLAEETLIFAPESPFPRDETCQVHIGDSAMAATGEVTLSRPMTWRFSTVRTPGILSTYPIDGTDDLDPGRDVRITFASPMATDVFTDFLTIGPEPEEVRAYWSDEDTEVRLYFPTEPASAYRVTLSADAPDRFGVSLGESLDIRFRTGNLSPLAYFKTRSDLGTYDAYTNTVVYAQARNVSRLDVALYSIPLGDFMLLQGYNNYSFRSDYQPERALLVREWSVPVNTAPNVTALIALDMADSLGAQLTPGTYYLTLSAPEVRALTSSFQPDTFTLVRSRLNLVLKQSLHESLVWVTDLASGEPVANLPVTLYSENLQAYGEGTTDAAGIHFTTELPYTEETYVDLWDDAFAATGQPGDENFAVVFNGWDSGINAWTFDLPYSYSQEKYAGYLYTDRPIYRPGQTVYFKGILRTDDDAAYSLPDISQVNATVTDADGTEVYRDILVVNDMGSFYSELTLDESASLGGYYIQVSAEEEDFYIGASFRVAEYRKPEFQVDVQTDQPAYLNGKTIDVTAEASYYFGGAVADADVSWYLLSNEYWFNYVCPQGESCPYYSWTDYEWGESTYGYGGYGRLIAEGVAVTDGQGQVVFDVPADISDEINSRIFTIEANVTDINDQVVSNRTTAIVHQGEYYIGLAPQGRIASSGEEKSVDILAVDWDSEPVPDVDLDVIFMKHEWYSVREEAEDGASYWTWTTRDIPVYTTTVTTDDAGKAVSTFSPEDSGTYRVRVIGEDDKKNEIRSSAYFWVWGEGPAFWRYESNNRIDLIVDADSYEVGDIVRILVPSPYQGAVKALVTIERGHLMDVDVIEVEGSSYLIEIPVLDIHVPNMFVSVILVEGSSQNADALATFKMGEVMIPISTESRALNISLTPDRSLSEGDYYQPRETVSYQIKVTDASGKPVEAELSLRMADLAVLALADDTTGSLLDRFWRERGLSVRTSTVLAETMEAYNRELAPGAKGGGGGAEDGGFVRSEFADTAFWDPVVRTDADGKAVVQIKLPDNLTTWRTQARGITADTLVGRADSDVISTLDLLVRPVLPRFFVVGDKADIATIVHNNTGQMLETEVTLTATGVSIEGESKYTIQIEANDKVEVIWPVTVNDMDEVSITMEASAGDYYDGRKDVLPVYSYVIPEVMGTAGRLSEAEIRQELIQLPRQYDPERGDLTVQIDGSLTAATQDALRYLEEYPYECTEQTVSRFLPNVMTYQALAELGIDRPELRNTIKESLSTALQRLYNEQHYDGGWGWWSSDESNPYLTAYVIQAMLEAHRAGFSVDLNVVKNGVDYLRDRLQPVTANSPAWRANRLAYQLYVIADYIDLIPGAKPAGELGYAINLFEDRQLLNQYAKAQLAVALSLLDVKETKRVDTLLSDLVDDAVFSAAGIHWEEAMPDYWNMNTDIHTTSVAVWALSRLRPESELLPNAVRWLMSVRDADQGRMVWESTHTTSWALMSLVSYMRVSGELEGEFNYTVSLNGLKLLDGEVNQDTIDESNRIVIQIVDLMAERGNQLLIERLAAEGDQSGEGQLYYTAHLRYFQPVDLVKAEDRGISVVRQYSPVDNPESYISGAQVGDIIRVKLTVIAPTDLYYVMVEDPLPAGCEAVDVTLNTNSVVGESPEIANISAREQDTWYRTYGWGWWYFSHSEIRDEKVSLFATYLPRGTYEYTYIMRASVAGQFNVIPTTASQMYFPEVWGRSDGASFMIEP